MLLKCEIVISNTLSPNTQKCHATINVGKKKAKSEEDIVFFTIFTSRNKIGTEYLVKENILQVHQKYVDEGKCTLRMKVPPHDLIISKAAVNTLKTFLHILKLAFKGQDTSGVAVLSSTFQPKNCDLEKPKSSLKILSRSKYPLLNSFPLSLESLIVNQCELRKFDMRILKLKELRVLDLSHNKLSTLCDNFDNLIHLSSIILSENLFQDIPPVLLTGEILKRLQLLDLSSNQIKFVPHKLTNHKALVTLNLNRNQIEYLPSKFGGLSNLRNCLLNCNKLSLLPWSFSMLHLDQLDLSDNLFGKTDVLLNTYNKELDDIPTLFELSARFTIKNKIDIDGESLPRFVQEQLNNAKFCPCGSPCLSHCVPYIKPFNLCQVSSSVSYDHILPGLRMMAQIVGYLCSKECYKKWTDNPHTLFTSRKRKRISKDQGRV